MEIRIGSYVAASFLLEREPDQWHTLIVPDSGLQSTDFVKAYARFYYFLRFDDVELLRENKKTPTRAMIEQGLNFAKGKDKKTMVAVGKLTGCTTALVTKTNAQSRKARKNESSKKYSSLFGNLLCA